jgi:predicted RNase H-like nuclease (RuvC/YqgF family)
MDIETETITNYKSRLAATEREIARLTMENSRMCCLLMTAMRENMQLRKQVTPEAPKPTELGGFKVYQ